MISELQNMLEKSNHLYIQVIGSSSNRYTNSCSITCIDTGVVLSKFTEIAEGYEPVINYSYILPQHIFKNPFFTDDENWVNDNIEIETPAMGSADYNQLKDLFHKYNSPASEPTEQNELIKQVVRNPEYFTDSGEPDAVLNLGLLRNYYESAKKFDWQLTLRTTETHHMQRGFPKIKIATAVMLDGITIVTQIQTLMHETDLVKPPRAKKMPSTQLNRLPIPEKNKEEQRYAQAKLLDPNGLNGKYLVKKKVTYAYNPLFKEERCHEGSLTAVSIFNKLAEAFNKEKPHQFY